MATLHEYTTSSNVKISDEEAVKDLFSNYDVVADHQIEDSKLTIFGYNGFRVYDEHEEGYDEIVTEEFLHKLTEYVQEPFRIQTVGHEKLRFPVVAYQYRVTPDGVYHRDLMGDESQLDGGEIVEVSD